MRRIVLLITICCQVFWVAAQKKAPKWMDKHERRWLPSPLMEKITRRKRPVRDFSLPRPVRRCPAIPCFKDAARATVTDADGKEYPVSRILGADELYDVIKFKVEVPKKVVFLPIAREPISRGVTAYLMPYSTGKITKFGEGPVSEVSKLKEPFSYYKLSMGAGKRAGKRSCIDGGRRGVRLGAGRCVGEERRFLCGLGGIRE